MRCLIPNSSLNWFLVFWSSLTLFLRDFSSDRIVHTCNNAQRQQAKLTFSYKPFKVSGSYLNNQILQESNFCKHLSYISGAGTALYCTSFLQENFYHRIEYYIWHRKETKTQTHTTSHTPGNSLIKLQIQLSFTKKKKFWHVIPPLVSSQTEDYTLDGE